MAWVLIQPKLRLLTNAVHSSRRARCHSSSARSRADRRCRHLRGPGAAERRYSVTLTTAIFTVFAFGWLILPIMSFGLDGTLDPAMLALYPLRTRSLPSACSRPPRPARGRWPT